LPEVKAIFAERRTVAACARWQAPYILIKRLERLDALAAHALDRELDGGHIKADPLGDPTPYFLWVGLRLRRRFRAPDARTAKPIHSPNRTGVRVSTIARADERKATTAA